MLVHRMGAVLFVAVMGGCAARQKVVMPWRLEGAILQPPRAVGASIELTKARSSVTKNRGCDVSDEQIQLAWKGRAARVTVDARAVAAAPAIALNGPQAGTGEQVRDLSWWPRFREELAKREEAGCMALGEAGLVAGRIVQNLPLPPALAYKLRYGDYLMDGHLDLGTEFGLKSVSPLLKAGVAKYGGPADVAGYETAYYDLVERGGGLRLALRGVERMEGRTTTKVARPTGAVLGIADSARHVRLFFRTWRIAGEYRVALLATHESGVMDAMTAEFERDPERFCRETSRARATCLSVPIEMMLTAEMRVRVNGKAAYVPVGGTVAEVVRGAGGRVSEDVVKTLQVMRPYQGVPAAVEFDRSRTDILSFTLMGGDEVRW